MELKIMYFCSMIEIPRKKIDKLLAYLAIEGQKISIVTHTNPDGDTIGSSLGLAWILKQMKKEVSVITPDALPDFLQWLPVAEESIDYSSEKEIAKKSINEADLIFCMDYNAAHRTGKFAHVLEAAKAEKIMIDHHLFPDDDFFALSFSYPISSSTSELLYQIAIDAGWEKYINNAVATSLFVGIMTDTGSFAHSCNRKEVFEASARLIELGQLEVKRIHDMIFNNFNENRLRFLGYCISKKLTVLADKKSAYIIVSQEDMRRFQVEEGDLEGVVNYALSIRGIEFATLIKERVDNIKLSFRSKTLFDVNAFARVHFNGGGHRNAAGGKSEMSLQETQKKLVELINDLEL